MPQYITDDSINFKWSAEEKESTLFQYQYGLHKCMTSNCNAEGCEPNICIQQAPCTGGQYYTNAVILAPVYSASPAEPLPITVTLPNTTRYRIAFNMTNEAQISGVACSGEILVDKRPPVIDLFDGPGECHPDLHSLSFSWTGHDGAGESGLASVQYAIGSGLGCEDLAEVSYLNRKNHGEMRIGAGFG